MTNHTASLHLWLCWCAAGSNHFNGALVYFKALCLSEVQLETKIYDYWLKPLKKNHSLFWCGEDQVCVISVYDIIIVFGHEE